MTEVLCRMRRPDVVLLIAEAIAGGSFLGNLSSMLGRHPELAASCLTACLPCISTFFTHAITVVETAAPPLQNDPQWSKV